MGSVWVGSQDGNAVAVLPEDISIKTKKLVSAFGKAFYQSTATYFVYPLWLVVLYNTLWQIFCSIYHNLPPVIAIYLSMYIGLVNRHSWVSEVVKIVIAYSMPVYIALSFTALLIDVVAKWVILGRRVIGTHAWDTSSYCQRWQLYLTIQEIRRGEAGDTGVLELLQGSQYLVWYFRALGGSIGKEVCLYPNGGDPMMTEPDLVTIGDYACVDDAALIAHINTKGVFSLNNVIVGNGCVLKSGSRLLSGTYMDAHSMLLEHTLILAGDSVDSMTVWQGWPSKTRKSMKQHRKELFSLLHRLNEMYERTCCQQWCCCCFCCSDCCYDAKGANDDQFSTVYVEERAGGARPRPKPRRHDLEDGDSEGSSVIFTEATPLLS